MNKALALIQNLINIDPQNNEIIDIQNQRFIFGKI